MSNEEIYNKFVLFLKKYYDYFLSNVEIWEIYLEKIVNYINSNYDIPSEYDDNKEIAILGKWITRQKKFLKIKQI